MEVQTNAALCAVPCCTTLGWTWCVSPGELGLEVCPGREATTEYGMGDEWTPCDPQEGAITVNVGDALMYWSDDKLKVSSGLHWSQLQLVVA